MQDVERVIEDLLRIPRGKDYALEEGEFPRESYRLVRHLVFEMPIVKQSNFMFVDLCMDKLFRADRGWYCTGWKYLDKTVVVEVEHEVWDREDHRIEENGIERRIRSVYSKQMLEFLEKIGTLTLTAREAIDAKELVDKINAEIDKRKKEAGTP